MSFKLKDSQIYILKVIILAQNKERVCVLKVELLKHNRELLEAVGG